MTIALSATPAQIEELTATISGVDWVTLNDDSIPEKADALFYLDTIPPITKNDFDVPVFIHAVTKTLAELNMPDEVVRINGWPGFLKKNQWEVAGKWDEKWVAIASALGKQLIPVPDQPGFITARVLSMIINEAWLALEEGVSSKAEIDIAMKLGTNYPMGPFEWGAQIGEQEIFNLLLELSETDKAYLPATSLQQLVGA